MADIAHERTEKILSDLQDRIAEEYAKAVDDMQKKYIAWAEQFAEQEAKQKALLEAGKITQEDYNNWRFRHEAIGKRWEAMRDVLAEDLENARNISLKISGEQMADVYALNANFATWQIEHDGGIDTGFTLYNHDAAEYLLKDTRQLMPGPSTKKAREIAANKAMQWDKQKIQSAVLQGILQGELVYKVAERLRGVAEMDYNASVRYARTMGTSAQNAGRYESFRRATRLGIDLTIEWQATLDDRTRIAHRYMHGQRTTVDEPFYTPDGYTIYYPADCTGESDAPQKEIWNCRCTLLAWVKGFEGDTVKESPKMHDMSFDEWQKAKPISDTQTDRKQYDEYKKLLGKNAPKSYNDFQQIKHTKPEEWEKLKAKADLERRSSRKTVQAGGHHYKTDKHSTKREIQAASSYEKFARENDTRLISINTGIPQKDIATIKHHVFTSKHKLYDGYGRFAPDYNMAVAWKRLREGSFEQRDITLLNHELLESTLEKMYNLTAAEAHARATEKYDWWGQLVKELGEAGEKDGLL